MLRQEFTIKSNDFFAAGEASARIKKSLQQIGIATDIIRRISVAVYEAEMNIVIHAYSGVITLDLESNKAKIVVKDKGPGIEDIDMAMKEGFSTASEEARRQGFGAGMGLPNINRAADSFEIESIVGKGTTLKLEFVL